MDSFTVALKVDDTASACQKNYLHHHIKEVLQQTLMRVKINVSRKPPTIFCGRI